MENTPGLTPGYEGEQGRRIRHTHPGQASWAGGGPAGKQCGDCHFYGGYMQKGVNRKTGDPIYAERRSRCVKFYQLMGRPAATPLPRHALACRYFQPREGSDPWAAFSASTPA